MSDLENVRSIETIGVLMTLETIKAGPETALVEIPLVSSNVDTFANDFLSVRARDENGDLPLTSEVIDGPDQNARDAIVGGKRRQWFPTRATQGSVTVAYEFPASAVKPPRGPAPPFSFLRDDDAVSGAGHIFLLLPPGDEKYNVTIHWNLENTFADARGITSLGEGLVSASEPMGGTELRMMFYMAGNIYSWPEVIPETGYFSAWHGTPSFDAEVLMKWTGGLYTHYSVLFKQDNPPPYGVFLRYNPINAGGGVGLHHSFVTTFGTDDPAEADNVKSTLAHEMFHTFQPYMDDPSGLESSWFGEGLATFYQTRLPARFGYISPELFLTDVNSTAARYYTSIMKNVPNSEIQTGFWKDTRIRTLPYDRGMLYFATINHALNVKSEGTQSLDDLLLQILNLQKSGELVTYSTWENLLESQLGASAVTDFRAFLEGETPIPDSAAFGPCFKRVTKRLRRYEVGFEPAVLAEPTRIVRGLVKGSAAEKAGLKNGDEIIRPIPQDSIQGNQTQILNLSLKREGQTFDVTYLPRGESVEAYQWARIPNVPNSECNF